MTGGIKRARLGNPEIKTSELIEKLVQQHWDEEGVACYLSNLGSRLKGDLPESQTVITGGLAEFIRRNPVVKVVQHPEISQKIGAVPLSVTLPDQVEELFAKKAGFNQKWAYRQEFWDAFIEPIAAGECRFVCMNDSDFEVSDGRAIEGKGKLYEITTEDQTKQPAEATTSKRAAATHEAINTWLEKNSLRKETFFMPKQNAHRRVGGRMDELFDVFGALPEEDLARISIPLDILFKFRSKK